MKCCLDYESKLDRLQADFITNTVSVECGYILKKKKKQNQFAVYLDSDAQYARARSELNLRVPSTEHKTKGK